MTVGPVVEAIEKNMHSRRLATGCDYMPWLISFYFMFL